MGRKVARPLREKILFWVALSGCVEHSKFQVAVVLRSELPLSIQRVDYGAQKVIQIPNSYWLFVYSLITIQMSNNINKRCLSFFLLEVRWKAASNPAEAVHQTTSKHSIWAIEQLPEDSRKRALR